MQIAKYLVVLSNNKSGKRGAFRLTKNCGLNFKNFHARVGTAFANRLYLCGKTENQSVLFTSFQVEK